MKKIFGICFFVLMTGCILTHSSLSLAYAALGLSLWYEKMVPVLLPFMILSGTLIRMGMTDSLIRPVIERILKVAFEYAMKRRKHLTVVDKANVLASSRLWRQIAQEMAPQYPEVTTDYMFVDNAAMKMIQEPAFFDVMVTENTFGDILTDEGSVISGSMGLLPSASTGESTPVFEPIHGSWPQAKGLNIANPLAQILSVAMLFEYFDLKEEGALIRKAVDASLDENVRTPEIQVAGGAKYGTKEVGQWIVDYIRKA